MLSAAAGAGSAAPRLWMRSARLAAGTPAKRAGAPTRYAKAAPIHLASDEAAFVHGTVIDGARTTVAGIAGAYSTIQAENAIRALTPPPRRGTRRPAACLRVSSPEPPGRDVRGAGADAV